MHYDQIDAGPAIREIVERRGRGSDRRSEADVLPCSLAGNVIVVCINSGGTTTDLLNICSILNYMVLTASVLVYANG